MTVRGIVTRDQWHARKPKNVSNNVHPERGGWAVHYTGADADEQSHHGTCEVRVRGIQAFHMDDRGWADIAYNFVVCKHGYVFFGRGWGVRSAAQGTNDGNDRYLAVVFLGDDTQNRDDVTDDGRDALLYIVHRGRGSHGVGPAVEPHSHFHSTSCPGDELRRFVHVLRP